MSTLSEVLDQHLPGIVEGGERDGLRDALIAREDEAADLIRVAAMNFGLFPQIVAEVLAQSGLGTPLTETERGMIRAQYEAVIAEIQRQQREGGG